MIISWCDKLASTPAVGFKFTRNYKSGDSIVQALAPLLNRLGNTYRQGFVIERHESTVFQFVTDDGFTYYFDADRMFVEFKHRLRARAQSGGPPIAELTSEAKPYTVLLSEVSNKAIEAALLVNGLKPPMLERIGIVSTTGVTGTEAPPGINRLINYLSKPWDEKIENYSINVTGVLLAAEDHTDKCVHSVTKPENPEQLMTIKFDWSREFKTPKPATGDILKKQAALVEAAALSYFEELGVGARFDDNITTITA